MCPGKGFHSFKRWDRLQFKKPLLNINTAPIDEWAMGMALTPGLFFITTLRFRASFHLTPSVPVQPESVKEESVREDIYKV